jgi:DNA-binding transcriptional ArsR family regulator
MPADELSSVLSALADPTRRAIVTRLANGEATVTEIAEPFDMTLPAVSKHIHILVKAGLVVQGRERQRRPCRLNSQPLKALSDWTETFRANWESSYSRLDDYMREVQQERTAESRGSQRKGHP